MMRPRHLRAASLQAASLIVAVGLLSVQPASASVVAYYNFNNSSNPDSVPDLSGNSHTGAAGGLAAYDVLHSPVDGATGGSFLFHGGGDVIVPDLGTNTGPGSFQSLADNNEGTVAFWERGSVTSNQTNYGLWGPDATTGGPARQFQSHNPWGDKNVYFDTGGCCDGATQRINGPIPSDYNVRNWHHWAMVKAADGTKTVYLDGNPLITGNNSNPIGAIDYVAVGNTGNQAAQTEGYNGNMDEFIVFNNALSQADVQRLMQQGGGAFVPEPGCAALLAVGALALLRRTRRA